MKTRIAIGVALLAAGAASADVVAFPDMTSGGTFTLDAGDTWQNLAADGSVSIADNAVAVLNVNGTWDGTDAEVQLGGVNGKLRAGNELQDVTLNIGSAGVVTWASAWVGGVWPGNTTDAGVEGVVINMSTGAQLNNDGSGFGPRFNGGGVWTGSGTGSGGGNAETLWEYVYNKGFLLIDGESVDTAGAFSDNFAFVGDTGGAHTLTAIPEPATLGLLAVFGGGVLFIRRRFMI
jgi:hypothetical protein